MIIKCHAIVALSQTVTCSLNSVLNFFGIINLETKSQIGTYLRILDRGINEFIMIFVVGQTRSWGSYYHPNYQDVI